MRTPTVAAFGGWCEACGAKLASLAFENETFLSDFDTSCMRKVEFSRCVAWDVLAHQFHSPSAKDGSFAWSATMNHQTTFRASPAFTSVHEDIYFSRIPTLLCTYLLMSQVGVMCENWIGRNKMLLTHSHALYFADKSFSLFNSVSRFFSAP